jgi:hypothetical protein
MVVLGCASSKDCNFMVIDASPTAMDVLAHAIVLLLPVLVRLTTAFASSAEGLTSGSRVAVETCVKPVPPAPLKLRTSAHVVGCARVWVLGFEEHGTTVMLVVVAMLAFATERSSEIEQTKITKSLTSDQPNCLSAT